MYDVLKYVHVLAAAIWVGGAFFIQLLALRVGQSTDPGDLPKFGRNIAFLGLRAFLPASLVLFVSGAAMVAQAWSFSQLWVSVSMALWFVSVLVGALYIGPRTQKVAELFEVEGPASESAHALTARIYLVSRLELLSFALIIALMVFKPGSGTA